MNFKNQFEPTLNQVAQNKNEILFEERQNEQQGEDELKEKFNMASELGRKVLSTIHERESNKLTPYFDPRKFSQEDFFNIISKAEELVCHCNSLKTNNLDKNGKVKKQANLPNATELIAEMLKDYFAEKSKDKLKEPKDN